MEHMPALDITVLIAYLAGVVGFGCWFVRRSPLHNFLIIVLGTATIIVVGFLLGQLIPRRHEWSQSKYD